MGLAVPMGLGDLVVRQSIRERQRRQEAASLTVSPHPQRSLVSLLGGNVPAYTELFAFSESRSASTT